MAEHADADVQRWLAGLDAAARELAEELASIVGAADPRLERAVKWGRLTFTVGGDWHHWLCGIAVSRKATRLVFHKGVLLDDPEELLTGSGRYVRELAADLARRRPDAVEDLIRSAIEHQTDHP